MERRWAEVRSGVSRSSLSDQGIRKAAPAAHRGTWRAANKSLAQCLCTDIDAGPFLAPRSACSTSVKRVTAAGEARRSAQLRPCQRTPACVRGIHSPMESRQLPETNRSWGAKQTQSVRPPLDWASVGHARQSAGSSPIPALYLCSQPGAEVQLVREGRGAWQVPARTCTEGTLCRRRSRPGIARRHTGHRQTPHCPGQAVRPCTRMGARRGCNAGARACSYTCSSIRTIKPSAWSAREAAQYVTACCRAWQLRLEPSTARPPDAGREVDFARRRAAYKSHEEATSCSSRSGWFRAANFDSGPAVLLLEEVQRV